MSDETKRRPSAQVQQELNNMLARSGAVAFNIRKQEKDLELMQTQIDSLNSEWVGAQAFEAEVAKAAADKAPAGEAPKLSAVPDTKEEG